MIELNKSQEVQHDLLEEANKVLARSKRLDAKALSMAGFESIITNENEDLNKKVQTSKVAIARLNKLQCENICIQ